MRVLVVPGVKFPDANAVIDLSPVLSREHGIEVVTDPARPWDLGWISLERFQEPGPGGPLVIDAPYDEVSLVPDVVRALESPGVRFVTRPAKFRSARFYAEPTFQGSLHREWIRKSAPWCFDGAPEEPVPVSPAHLDRLVLSYSYPVAKHCRPLAGPPVDMRRPRPVDVSFIGTTHYRASAVALHRQLCVNSLNAIRGRTVVCMPRRALPTTEYHSHLLDTRIVVSPWGWGEHCYRDAEAILAGCVLIKPDSDHVESWPDLYRSGEIYIRCQPDFSDLPSVVERILDNWWDFEESRESNRLWLVEEIRPWRLAARMARIFRAALDGGPDRG